MQYSQSHDEDIMVHFVGGGQGLWSQLRSLPWSEVELIANGGKEMSDSAERSDESNQTQSKNQPIHRLEIPTKSL